MEIPRIIHQTARSADFPPLIQTCVDSLRSINHDWDYRFYTDEDWKDVITSGSPFAWEHLMRYPAGIQKSDIFRCAALYEHGGLYADVDVLGVRKIDSLINSACELGIIGEDTELVITTDHPIHSRHFFGSKEILMNNFMLAKPGGRFLEIFLEEMARQVAASPCDTTEPLDTTGPLAMSRIIREHGGPTALKIAVVPYFWINPIPDMTLDIPERPVYRRMIADGSWKTAIAPYFVHCWWHSYLDLDTVKNYEGLWRTPGHRNASSKSSLPPTIHESSAEDHLANV